MILRSLRLKNFRKYRECSVTFPEGVVGIVGPNGSGKSTLFEALAWALYGNSMSRNGGRGLHIRGAPCEAEVEFDAGEERWRVRRRLTHAGLYSMSSVLQGSTLLATGSRATGAVLRRILPPDGPSFLRTFYARQGEIASLVRESPMNRQRALARILGLDWIDRAAALVAQDRRVREAQARAPPRVLESPDAGKSRAAEAKVRVERLREELHAVSERIASLETRRDRVQRLRAKAELLASEIRRLTAQRERLGRASAEAGARFDIGRLVKVRAEIQGLSETAQRCARRLRAIRDLRGDRCPLCGGPIVREAALAGHRASLDGCRPKLEALRAEERSLQAALESSHRRAEADRLDREERRRRLESEAVDRELSSIGWDDGAWIAASERKQALEEELRGAVAAEAAARAHLEDARRREQSAGASPQARAEAAILRRLEELLHDFRTALLAGFLRALGSEASEAMAAASAGRYSRIRIGPDFHVRLDDGGRAYSIYRYSGGEQDLAALSLRIGLTRLVAPQGLARFLVLDEAFVGLDRERRRALLAALHRLVPAFRQIFVITHCEEIQESLPTVLRVRETADGRAEIGPVHPPCMEANRGV
ncbi:MAG: AAA family ATPase [Planctomycetes bacterium]|nr:AAA family ATPase [Planctomycetota bacterium]